MIGGMTSESMTTIKVPVRLRERLRQRAEAEHVTQAEALERLLDEAEHPGLDAILDHVDARWTPLLDRLA